MLQECSAGRTECERCQNREEKVIGDVAWLATNSHSQPVNTSCGIAVNTVKQRGEQGA